MNRKDLEILVGSRVRVWTPFDGVYTGVLLEITGENPCCGRVRVDGVLGVATPWEAGKTRRGTRPGEIIEARSSSISATAQTGSSYLEALRAERAKFATYKKGQFWVTESLGALDAQIAAEQAGGAPSYAPVTSLA